jgi:hypothetical protein
MTPDELIEHVNSRDSFLEFVAALSADLRASNAQEALAPSSPYTANALDWENPTLDRFLDALHAWTDDMGDRISEPPSWRTFANMLLAAKVYE